MENLEKNQKSLSLVEWWFQVKNKVKKIVIEHSARLKQENSDIENNLKQQLEQLANSLNFKLYLELKKKLAKLQIDHFPSDFSSIQITSRRKSFLNSLFKNVKMSPSAN